MLEVQYANEVISSNIGCLEGCLCEKSIQLDDKYKELANFLHHTGYR